jgi:ABC-type transporter Mla subunit MlaD
VVVGRVESITFDDKSFQAERHAGMESRYSFPKDSSLKILTSGLLGEQYIGIEAGADEKNLRRRHHHRHAIRRGAGKPDQPVPLQQGGGRQPDPVAPGNQPRKNENMTFACRHAMKK